MFAGAALGATATRFIATTRRTDAERAGRIVGLVSCSALASALLFGLFIVALSSWIAQAVLDAPDLDLALGLGAVLVGMGVLRGVQDAILAGFEAFRRIAVLRFIEGCAALIFLPLLVAQFGPAGGIAALTLGLASAFAWGIGFVVQELRSHGVVPRWDSALLEWRMLRDFSAPSLLAISVTTPVLWACMLMLSQTSGGLAEVGVYNSAYQWQGPLIFVPMAISSVSLPILTQAWEGCDRAAFRQQFFQVLALGITLTLVPALAVVVLSPMISKLYGSGFESNELVLTLLALAAPLHVASAIAISAIQSMNQPWYLPVFSGIWGGTILFVSTLLVRPYGAGGLAMAFLASYFLLATLSVIFIISSSRLTKGKIHDSSP
jgi:O-antigen/teichoic acid export membrane protein